MHSHTSCVCKKGTAMMITVMESALWRITDASLQSADVICFRKQALEGVLINVYSFRQWITGRPFSPIRRLCILLFMIHRNKLMKTTARGVASSHRLQKHWRPSLEVCTRLDSCGNRNNESRERTAFNFMRGEVWGQIWTSQDEERPRRLTWERTGRGVTHVARSLVHL